jgi:predicted GNAT family acetyltransferase
VWTPPALRGRGYGRAVVAGALAIARHGGVTGAILATGRHNSAAQAAYRAIGFERVGDYATLIFATDAALPGF